MDNLITCLNTVGYGLVAAFSFFIIPFSYFYYEEYDDDEEQTIKDRVFGALKYTSFFVVISLLLFLFGLFVKPSQRPPKLDLDWLEKLLMESSKWMNSLFCYLLDTYFLFCILFRWRKVDIICYCMLVFPRHAGIHSVYRKCRDNIRDIASCLPIYTLKGSGIIDFAFQHDQRTAQD